ncbi:unnamed protein product, partial [Durusdinium trenchii]
AEILFEHFGEVTEERWYRVTGELGAEKFLDACRVVEIPVWAAPKDERVPSPT